MERTGMNWVPGEPVAMVPKKSLESQTFVWGARLPQRATSGKKKTRSSGPGFWGQKMATFLVVYVFRSIVGAAGKWPHFSGLRTEKKMNPETFFAPPGKTKKRSRFRDSR